MFVNAPRFAKSANILFREQFLIYSIEQLLILCIQFCFYKINFVIQQTRRRLSTRRESRVVLGLMGQYNDTMDTDGKGFVGLTVETKIWSSITNNWAMLIAVCWMLVLGKFVTSSLCNIATDRK